MLKVYRELRSETKLSRKSWSADNPHNCTYDPPSQETEGYSDGEEGDYFSFSLNKFKSVHVFSSLSGSADLCVYPPPPLCRTKSAPVNAATSETCPRMLRAPSTEEQFEQNEEVMRRFFDKNLVKLSEEDVAHLGMKLLDCIEYRELRSETKLSRGINCIPTLVSGMFRRWTRKKGWDADLYQVKCILKEMGNNCMCHSLDAYIKEQSETLSWCIILACIRPFLFKALIWILQQSQNWFCIVVHFVNILMCIAKQETLYQ